MKKLRVLIAKPGLDGHDLGAKLIARALMGNGAEVIYTGRQQHPGQIVEAAVQEDVKVIGLSYLSGAHLGLTGKIMEYLKKRGLEDQFIIVAGGVIPKHDIPALEQMGVAKVFSSGSPLKEIVDYFTSLEHDSNCLSSRDKVT